MMTVFFGDTEWQDAIDTNPAAVPSYVQVRDRFDRDAGALIARIRRRKRHKARHAAKIARRFVLVATATNTGSAIEWADAAAESAAGDADYIGLELDVESRQFIKLLVGNILLWLISERSLN